MRRVDIFGEMKERGRHATRPGRPATTGAGAPGGGGGGSFFPPAELPRLAVPALTRGRQPAVVNVASMCGRRGMPAWSEYSASKFALCGLTEALRGELARFDIDVLLVLPGLTRSNLGANLLRRCGRYPIDF